MNELKQIKKLAIGMSAADLSLAIAELVYQLRLNQISEFLDTTHRAKIIEDIFPSPRKEKPKKD